MKYEITYLVETEDKSAAVIDIITSAGGTYTETKKWGQRDLAYPINKLRKAFYYTGTIEIVPTAVTDLKNKLNYAKVAIRYLILSQEE